jgi:hypothetical protein
VLVWFGNRTEADKERATVRWLFNGRLTDIAGCGARATTLPRCPAPI